jgi:hypothetical protein
MLKMERYWPGYQEDYQVTDSTVYKNGSWANMQNGSHVRIAGNSCLAAFVEFTTKSGDKAAGAAAKHRTTGISLFNATGDTQNAVSYRDRDSPSKRRAIGTERWPITIRSSSSIRKMPAPTSIMPPNSVYNLPTLAETPDWVCLLWLRHSSLYRQVFTCCDIRVLLSDKAKKLSQRLSLKSLHVRTYPKVVRRHTDRFCLRKTLRNVNHLAWNPIGNLCSGLEVYRLMSKGGA